MASFYSKMLSNNIPPPPFFTYKKQFRFHLQDKKQISKSAVPLQELKIDGIKSKHILNCLGINSKKASEPVQPILPSIFKVIPINRNLGSLWARHSPPLLLISSWITLNPNASPPCPFNFRFTSET